MPFNSKEKSNSWGKTKERYTLGKKNKKTLDNNTTKTLKYFAFLFFFLLYCLHNNIYMNMFDHYSKGLVYGSSLLITLRNDKLFKDGFRLNFPFDLKLSFKSSRIHVCKKKKIWFSPFEIQKGSKLGLCFRKGMLPSSIQSTWGQEIQMQLCNLFDSFLSFLFPLRKGQGLFFLQNLQS